MTEPKRILIVGGVAGGASAAARARRLSEDAQIILIERGEHVSFANCGMPYHIGGAIAQRDRLLVQTPEGLRRRYRLDVRTRTEVVAIDRARREITIRNLATGQASTEPYDALVLSSGAEPIRPPLPGTDLPGVFTLRSLTDMDAIKRAVDALGPSANAVIVGGGYIGLEMAEALRQRQVGVVLVELAGQVMGPMDPEMAAPLHQQLRLHGVDLRFGASLQSIAAAQSGLQVQLSTGQSVPAGLVILAIGVRPDVALARQAGLAIGPRGGIVVDAHMRTSDSNIYAVGDAVEVDDFVGGFKTVIPLAGPANRQGRIAADNIFGRASAYAGTQGTAICKVFDLAAGMTGLSEKSLRRLGRPCEKVYVHPTSHASYYPGAVALSLKLLFDPANGKILGAQAVGADGVDKRIDVLATAIRAGMTVYNLEHLELCYAPPYGSAKDPVNYAGFVAANALRGDSRLCHVEDVRAPSADQFVLDVRTADEFKAGTIPSATNIPVDELRGRLDQLPRDRELLVFCQVGLRGYIACRMLSLNGFRCRNLTGGYKTYQMFQGDKTPSTPPAESSSPSCGSGPTQGSTPMNQQTRSDSPAAPSAPSASAGTNSASAAVVSTIDARGLQCPGPIMRLGTEMDRIQPGQAVTILASDPGFAQDVRAWCGSTGHECLDVQSVDGHFRAIIAKAAQKLGLSAQSSPAAPDVGLRNKTIVVFSSDLDRVMAAFIIANGARSMGSDVTMFFTFWGLNVLRRPEAAKVSKSLVERMFGRMMPRGSTRLTLSKMHMAGMGTAMMKSVMKQKNVIPLPDLIAAAQASGVRLVACTMTMDIMGIKPAELIDGVEQGGVAMYLGQAEQGHVNLFI